MLPLFSFQSHQFQVSQEHRRKRQTRSINDSTSNEENEESAYIIEEEADHTNLTCTHTPRQSSLLEMEDCEMEYSICVLYRPGSCKWHMNRKYSKCLAKRERKTQLMMEKYGPSMFGPRPFKLKGLKKKGLKSSSITKKRKSKNAKKRLHGMLP